MARPSQNLDKKLIAAAKRIAIKGGFSSLSIRGLCAKAGVNIGMFTYFFGTRDKFIERIHKEIFEDFLHDLKLVVNASASPIDKLKAGLLKLAKVNVRDRQLILGIFRDALNNEPIVKKMHKNFVPEDFILIFGIVKECQEAGDLPKDLDPLEILSILVPPLIMPAIFGDGFHHCIDKHIDNPDEYRVDDTTKFELRLNILLKGIKEWAPGT